MTSRLVMSSAVAAIVTMQALSAEPPPVKGALIAIAFSFHGSYSTAAVAGMESELAGLLDSPNLNIKLVERQQGRGMFVNGRILVVNIVGDCEPNELTRIRSSGALAWNDITDGHFQPFITVDCARLSRFLARELRGSTRDYVDRIMGRAIARVVAHEMYHFFTRTKRHSRSSALFRAALPAQSLIEDDVRFDDSELKNLEDGINTPVDCEH